MIATLKKMLENIDEGIVYQELCDTTDSSEYATLVKTRKILVKTINKLRRLGW